MLLVSPLGCMICGVLTGGFIGIDTAHICGAVIFEEVITSGVFGSSVGCVAAVGTYGITENINDHNSQ